MDYNAAAGSYNLSVTSKDASSVYEGTGKAPSANSPNIGAIVFKNTVMNETLNVEPNVWEANPNDTRLNPFPDGHGRIIITYIGGDDSNAPPPGGI